MDFLNEDSLVQDDVKKSFFKFDSEGNLSFNEEEFLMGNGYNQNNSADEEEEDEEE